MTTPRDLFRQAVAESAIAAKAILSANAGRIDSAVTLVLSGDVALAAAGTATVGSRADAAKKYAHVNGTCSCTDFAYAPDGWCAHRLARAPQVRADRAVRSALEPSPAQPPPHETSESCDATSTILGASTASNAK